MSTTGHVPRHAAPGQPGQPQQPSDTQVLPVVDDTTTLPPVSPATDAPPPVTEEPAFRPGHVGRAVRAAIWLVLAWAVLAMPTNLLSPFEIGVADIDIASRAVIFAIGGLSLHVLLGYCGQISLGHQAFVGIGAFTSAYLVTDLGLSFWVAIGVASLLGAVQAVLLGMVSLRVTGLYFALVTLAYGAFAESTLFGITPLTGGEGGKPAPRPVGFESAEHYYYLCLGFLVLVLWLDWRLTRSKAGRAMAALRENPRVASAYGIDVRAFTLVAFAVSGVFAGIAGALTAHHDEIIVKSSFDFRLALTFVLMTVVGGLRNRVGVVIGSAFFAILEEGAFVALVEGAIGGLGFTPTFFDSALGLPAEFVGLVVGPLLLLLTLTLYPGGIGQQIAPVRQWLTGGRFDRHAGQVREVEVTDVRA